MLGYRVCVYVPFGREWYPYFMRRLAERPANVLFLARNLLPSFLRTQLQNASATEPTPGAIETHARRDIEEKCMQFCAGP
jgi:proline dehydrogenase